MTVLQCDRCGQLIGGKTAPGKVPNPTAGAVAQADLCAGCEAAFKAWFAAGKPVTSTPAVPVGPTIAGSP
jgi:hypothetical protein